MKISWTISHAKMLTSFNYEDMLIFAIFDMAFLNEDKEFIEALPDHIRFSTLFVEYIIDAGAGWNDMLKDTIEHSSELLFPAIDYIIRKNLFSAFTYIITIYPSHIFTESFTEKVVKSNNIHFLKHLVDIERPFERGNACMIHAIKCNVSVQDMSWMMWGGGFEWEDDLWHMALDHERYDIIEKAYDSHRISEPSLNEMLITMGGSGFVEAHDYEKKLCILQYLIESGVGKQHMLNEKIKKKNENIDTHRCAIMSCMTYFMNPSIL
jgi:hypothetical protein